MDAGTGQIGEIQCSEFTTEIKNYMISMGFIENSNVFEYIDKGGIHNEASWGARFYLPMQDLYPATSV